MIWEYNVGVSCLNFWLSELVTSVKTGGKANWKVGWSCINVSKWEAIQSFSVTFCGLSAEQIIKHSTIFYFQIIIMACREFEMGRVSSCVQFSFETVSQFKLKMYINNFSFPVLQKKCERYWPPHGDDALRLGEFQITCVSVLLYLKLVLGWGGWQWVNDNRFTNRTSEIFFRRDSTVFFKMNHFK